MAEPIARAVALRTIEELERIHGYQIDAKLPDGTHRYWSTHCRHDRHDDCSAAYIPVLLQHGQPAYQVAREPAQCKTCAAQCVCPCHQVTR